MREMAKKRAMQIGARSSFEELAVWARKNFPDKQEFYLLDSNQSCLRDPEGKLEECQVLYKTGEKTAMAEEYIVYLIKL